LVKVTRSYNSTQQQNVVQICLTDLVKGDERPRHTH